MLDPGGFILAFFHLLGVIVVLGSLAFLLLVLFPVFQKDFSPEQVHKLTAKVIQRLHPLLLLCYGVLIMTGAWMLTRYKIEAGVNYFAEYGKPLSIKLGFVFLSVMVACYQFFGLGLGIVYHVEEAYDSANKEDLTQKIKRLRLVAFANVLILLIIVFFGLRLSHI